MFLTLSLEYQLSHNVLSFYIYSEHTNEICCHISHFQCVFSSLESNSRVIFQSGYFLTPYPIFKLAALKSSGIKIVTSTALGFKSSWPWKFIAFIRVRLCSYLSLDTSPRYHLHGDCVAVLSTPLKTKHQWEVCRTYWNFNSKEN